MINLPFSETKENNAHHQRDDKKQQRSRAVNAANILTSSNRHVNSNANIHRRSSHRKDEQEWRNHGNGVFSHHSQPSSHIFDSSNAKRRDRPAVSLIEPSTSSSFHSKSLQRRHTAIPASCITSSPIKSISANKPSNHVSVSPKNKRISTLHKRYILLCSALVLALTVISIDISHFMEYATNLGTVTTSKEWILNLPVSLGIAPNKSIIGSSVLPETKERRTFSGSAYSESMNSNVNLVGLDAVSMQEEWNRVREMSKKRARQRKMRTSPKHGAAGVAGTTYGQDPRVVESLAPPTLVLDIPSHRPLNNDLIDGISKKLRRLEASATNVCGVHAKEASQLIPSAYPESAALTSNSRVVVTGALSQLGMEVILALHEQCGVSYIMGIDSAYPNTRQDRIEMMEWRNKYLAKRVPGYQKLMVPVFGIHPHPKLGEEVKYEAVGDTFSIMRFQPTHIVHLAGMEEGMGEHVDYGDNTDASPFASESNDMMRRFESLVSMDQVLMALGNAGRKKPQLVYVSSNEASDQSGVHVIQNGQIKSSPTASLYGTTSVIKEMLASYYHRHHGVESVGLRVPTLLGPFARPGSLIYDLAERTVRNAAGKNVKGVPKYQTHRDRYDLSTIWKKRDGAIDGRLEQIAFASDVAQAVIASMQFRGDSDRENGPTILRLGSTFSTSMKDIRERMEGYLPSYNHWESSGEDLSSSTLSIATSVSRGLSIYDVNRNQDLLGWSHSTRLHEGTKSILASHVLKAYPFGLPASVPSHETFQQIISDSFTLHDRHSMLPLPCASGCRWPGFCTSSSWDDVIQVTKSMTQSCPYVLYTVDLRPELVKMEKQSSPSQRSGWEDRFCKIAFVSSSSKLAKGMYGHLMVDGTPQHAWNGKRKDGYWFVVVVHGSQYTLNEAERSMLKLAPNNIFNDRVEKAMYVNHRRVCLTTDQATGVMRHLEMKGRDHTDKKTIVAEDKTQIQVKLPPRAPRHSIFFTNRYIFADEYDTSNARNLAKFVMTNMGIAETSDIRAQTEFYQQTAHFTRTNTGRSANYQEWFQENLFPYDFLRTTWLVHELKSHEGHDLRCEMYQEHSMWGNSGMEDLSIGYVLASRKVRLQLGKMAAPQYEGPEEWYPLLVPKEPTDEDAIAEGPVYLDYLEEAQKTAKDEAGAELYITFLPQKRND